MRLVTATVFLIAQGLSILYAQLGSSRYFCWAPNDYMVSYDIRVEIQGKRLSPSDVERRYRLPANGVYQNIASHLIDNLRQYETTYGRNDRAYVLLTYSTNGTQERSWEWNSN